LSDSSIAHDVVHRIKPVIGYPSRAAASASEEDVAELIDAGKLASAEVMAIIGVAQFAQFEWLVSSPARTGKANKSS
jgi:hypothetical protein